MTDWADLNTDLLLSIVDRCALREKLCLRGVCTAWRGALAPLSPSLLVLAAEFWRTSPLLVPFQRSSHLVWPCMCSRFIGSSNGCFIIASHEMGIFLFNPLTGEEIELLPMKNCSSEKVHKIVFAPNPKPHDYTAVALCDGDKIAYIKTPRNREWFILDGVGYGLTDLAYDVDGGKVFCLTEYGDVHVLYIPRGRLRRPIVMPLLVELADLPRHPEAVFGSPYDSVSRRTGAKQIFLCNGSVYQAWRNTAGAIEWQLPAGGRFSMSDDEIFVLRYHPGRRPCWDVVQDLGGCSVFLGKNNPAVVRAAADGVQGVKANCVYWIGDRSTDVPMVFDFDMATRTNELCVLPFVGDAQAPLCRSSCWHFFNDNIAAVTGVGTFS